MSGQDSAPNLGCSCGIGATQGAPVRTGAHVGAQNGAHVGAHVGAPYRATASRHEPTCAHVGPRPAGAGDYPTTTGSAADEATHGAQRGAVTC